MNLKELRFPVRAFWDLSPATGNSAMDYGRVCDELAGIRILSLSLSYRGDVLTPAFREVLGRLKELQMAVFLTIPLSAASDMDLAVLSALQLRRLFLEASSLEELRTSPVLSGPGNTPIPCGISFMVGHSNRREIPGLIDFCLGRGIRHLIFPMERLENGRAPFFFSEEELQETGHGLRGMRTSAIQCEIHDPFLWRIFYPDLPFPEAGCQAANSMIYITPDGDVFPCPSLPVLLGNVQESGLRDILESPARKSLREELSRPPGECEECEEAAACLGGCRGRGYIACGNLDSRDPGCSLRSRP